MPLKIEIVDTATRAAVSAGPMLQPGNRPGSISDNKPDGLRDVYVFKCRRDDAVSIITKSGTGADSASGNTREIAPLTGFEVIKVLKRGDEPYELTVRTDSRPTVDTTYRFTHL